MSERLFIIGNGFDLYHGIPSAYTDFKAYLNTQYDAYDFVEKMERFIDPYNLWSSFEHALGELDDDSLRDNCSGELMGYGDDNWKDSYNHSYQFELESALDFTEKIPYYLNAWISNIDLEGIAPKTPVNSSQSTDRFITFNYTRTLEQIYNIPLYRITHIHGVAGYNAQLVVGHGNTKLGTAKHRWNEDDDFRMQQGEEIIAHYWSATLKRVPQIIAQTQQLWNSLRNVSEVIILGHSLAEVDMPYFRMIQQSVRPDCKWYISFHSPSSRSYLQHQLSSIGVPCHNISSLQL